MGAAAAERRREDRHAPPHLRVVPRRNGRSARTAGDARRVRVTDVAACRRGFHVACAILVTTCAIGMVRVELSVRAAETALATNVLREEIDAERLRNESLEDRRLALESPGRIESIATLSMGMSVAESVTYIDLVDPQRENPATDAEAYADGGGGIGDAIASVFASMVRMTAGTAQVLMAGDAGLAPPR